MLPNYLANIKSSGIYRFVFDKSELPGQEAETLRLVIGYSEKGPFNTPVYVKTEDEFKKIYGGTSKKMERYGMWFHRLAIQALKAGPILAFNLKNFEGEFEGDDVNKVEYTTFNPSGTIFHVVSDQIVENLKMAVKDLYNTDRFWTLEPEQLEDYVNDQDEQNHTQTPKGYITIATTDSKDTSVTVFMRGYEPKGYDVPFMEWYSSVLNGAEVPSYLEGHERDLVSQYWAEMFIFKGQFTPEIAASDKLAKFFNVSGDEVTLKPYIVNAFGEKIDTLDALAANDASNFVKKYTGILLPDFRNASNTVISLDSQVNSDNYVHKLMMRFNQDMLYSIDLEDEDGFQLSDLDTTGWSKGPDFNKPMMSLTQVEPIKFAATFAAGQWNYDAGTHAGENADYYKYEGLKPELDGFTMTFNDEDDRFGKTGIREGDSIFAGVLAHVVKISSNPGRMFTSYGDDSGATEYGTGKVIILENDGVVAHVKVIANSVPEFVDKDYYVAANSDAEFVQLFTDKGMTSSEEIWVKIGAEFNIYTVQLDRSADDGVNITSGIYKCVSSVTATSAYIKPLYLKGYVYGNPKPATTKMYDKWQWQKYMLNALTEYRGLRIALTSRVDLEYRYIVDTFEGFVEPECKAMLSTLCKEKDNSFAILNFPAIKTFSKSHQQVLFEHGPSWHVLG